MYLYLLNYVIEFRLQNEKNILDGSIADFFDMMLENFAAKIRFDIEYPLFGAFLHNVMQEKNSKELGDIQANIKNRILTLLILEEKEDDKKSITEEMPATPQARPSILSKRLKALVMPTIQRIVKGMPRYGNLPIWKTNPEKTTIQLKKIWIKSFE